MDLAFGAGIVSLLLAITGFFAAAFFRQTQALVASVQHLEVAAASLKAGAEALGHQIQSVAEEMKELRKIHERLARIETRVEILEDGRV